MAGQVTVKGKLIGIPSVETEYFEVLRRESGSRGRVRTSSVSTELSIQVTEVAETHRFHGSVLPDSIGNQITLETSLEKEDGDRRTYRQVLTDEFLNRKYTGRFSDQYALID